MKEWHSRREWSIGNPHCDLVTFQYVDFFFLSCDPSIYLYTPTMAFPHKSFVYVFDCVETIQSVSHIFFIKLSNSHEESFMLGKQAGKVVFHRAKGQLLNKCVCLRIVIHFLNPKKEKVQKNDIQGAVYCRPGDTSVRTA